MRISDEKVKAALDRIQDQKKNSIIEAVLKDLEVCQRENDPLLMFKKINNMKHVFAMFSEKNKDNSIEVYNEIMESLTNAISEHIQILAEHAKESLSNLQ
jgi:translation initiation factor 2 alpha subunit (eIF-2alpha)